MNLNFEEKHKKIIAVALIGIILLVGHQNGWWNLEFITQALIDFTQTDEYQEYGIWVLLIYAGTPSFVIIPNEVFEAPLIFAVPEDEQQAMAFKMALVASAGGFIGDSLLYFLFRHGTRLGRWLVGMAPSDVLEKEHAFHKYGKYIFLGSPLLPWIAEIPIAFAGITHMSYRIIAPYLLAGNILRNMIGFLGFFGAIQWIF